MDPSPLRPAPAAVRHVALAFPMGLAHLQPLVRGIEEYARAHGRWSFTTAPESAVLAVGRLRGWGGHGVIAALTTPADRAVARSLGMPVVTVSGSLRQPGVPRVTTNNPGVGRLAAEHLLGRGFRHFGYYGPHRVWYAQQRGKGFAARLKVDGRRASVHLARLTASDGNYAADELRRLDEWLSRLPRPAAVFAANDLRARMVLDAAERLGLAVPDELGVIGADDDRVTCESSVPPLSSVRCDWHRAGTAVAALLDRLMAGETLPPIDRLIDPLGVVGRASTDVLVVDHPAVSQAVRFIRQHLGEPFDIAAVLREVAVSRRSLELAFVKTLGCTPLEFISRQRAERARALLGRTPGMKLSAVARACGFPDARRFRVVFRRVEGVTPAQYRRALRGVAGRKNLA